MTDKEIAERIKKLLPYWKTYKKSDSIMETHELIMILFSNIAQIMEDLENAN